MKILSAIIILILAIGCGRKGQKAVEDSRNIISTSLTIKDSLLIYSTWSNEIIVENFISKKKIFKRRIPDNCYAKPFLASNRLYFPASDSVFTCVDILTSKTIWSLPLKGKCKEFHVIDNSIIANSKSYGLIGIDANSGKLRFELLYKYGGTCTIPDLSPYIMSWNKNSFFVCDWQCRNISAYDVHNGKLFWAKSSGESFSNVLCKDRLLFWGMNKFYKGGEIALKAEK